ncbi:MAG TPA: 2-hydroxy-3-oxopropionate reductase [Ktedonobacteraceae bacterium]|nr:2-hydroxy-3-oxopropionate reductase [Ktedonobacteraceae bacterium]
MMSTRIGFIGLGIMGKPMAHNLLKAGHKLVVYNRSQAPVKELAADGATGADSPKAVASQSEVVITMLPDSPQVQEVMTGKEGVLAGAKAGTLVIDMSTISPVVTQEVAKVAQAQGVRMLDAPVSGGDVGARQGTLSIMVGGSAEDFEQARPIFEVLGKTVVHVGGTGAGQVVKACNQIVVALTIEAVSEALVLGSKAGVDPSVILKVLSGGLAANRVMEVRGPNFLQHNFQPGFKIALHHKDLGIALAAGREYGVPLPVTALVDQMLQALKLRGQGDQDHSAILTLIEDLAQHRIGESR